MDPTPIYQFSAPKGEFLEPPPPSSPITTYSYQLRPGLVAMVQEQSFGGLESECPYEHLREFEQLCNCLVIPGLPAETLRWLLFPFSLTGEAKSWHSMASSKVGGSWEALKNSFVFISIQSLRSLNCGEKLFLSSRRITNNWGQHGHASRVWSP